MIQWQDLLGVPFVMGGDDPYTGLDCWGMAREVCRRAGLTLRERPQVIAPRETTERTVTALVRVPYAVRVGDMIFSDPEELDYPSHVATLVTPGWAIDMTRKHGARVLPLHRTLCTHGIWRVPE